MGGALQSKPFKEVQRSYQRRDLRVHSINQVPIQVHFQRPRPHASRSCNPYSSHRRCDSGTPPAPVDEILEFQEGSYVSAIEGMWRIFEFELSHRIPNAVRLAVHLEDQQTVYFR